MLGQGYIQAWYRKTQTYSKSLDDIKTFLKIDL